MPGWKEMTLKSSAATACWPENAAAIADFGYRRYALYRCTDSASRRCNTSSCRNRHRPWMCVTAKEEWTEVGEWVCFTKYYHAVAYESRNPLCEMKPCNRQTGKAMVHVALEGTSLYAVKAFAKNTWCTTGIIAVLHIGSAVASSGQFIVLRGGIGCAMAEGSVKAKHKPLFRKKSSGCTAAISANNSCG